MSPVEAHGQTKAMPKMKLEQEEKAEVQKKQEQAGGKMRPVEAHGQTKAMPKVKFEQEEKEEVQKKDPVGAQGRIKSTPNDKAEGQTKAIPKKKKREKRWTWSKPKDMPKRPLSAYNIFFQHTRLRILEGLTEEATKDEIILSMEHILSRSATRRKRDRRSHGKISFGNLASVVSEKWKGIEKNRLALFKRYAEIEKNRYNSELAAWKAKKESHAGGTRDVHDSKPSSSSSATLDSSESSYSSLLTDSHASSCEEHRQHDSGFAKRIDRGASEHTFEREPTRCRELRKAEAGTMDSRPRTIIGSSIDPFETGIETANDKPREMIERYHMLKLQHEELTEEIKNLSDSSSTVEQQRWRSNDMDTEIDPAPLNEIEDYSKWFVA